jgi:topoisomerase IA-like protein
MFTKLKLWLLEQQVKSMIEQDQASQKAKKAPVKKTTAKKSAVKKTTAKKTAPKKTNKKK